MRLAAAAVAFAALTAAQPALAQETVSFASVWNPAVQLTAERASDEPSVDVASQGWISADWVLEPAPASFGPGAFYMKNAWRNSYLTYIHEYRPKISEQGHRISNTQLLPKATDSTNDLVARGQVWVFEPAPRFPNVVRIRVAHYSFGQQYLTIRQDQETTSSIRPYASYEQRDHPGSFWVRFNSSHRDQTQCVKNLSFTVFDVDWYLGRDVAVQSVKDKLTLVPPSTPPALSERKSLGFESCENMNQRMVAVVRLVGKTEVSTGVGFIATATFSTAGMFLGNGPGALAGYYGGTEFMDFLVKKPDTIYIGVPGKLGVKGTLYDASGEMIEEVSR